MLIKIIRGTYGLKCGNIIKPKTCSGPPFHVERGEGERLAQLGIAEIVGVSAEDKFELPLINEPNGDNDEGYEGAEGKRDAPEYSEDSTNAELQAIAKEYGIEFPQRANKAQMLDALDEFFDGAPEISAREPE